jgi:hypothetical protein
MVVSSASAAAPSAFATLPSASMTLLSASAVASAYVESSRDETSRLCGRSDGRTDGRM